MSNSKWLADKALAQLRNAPRIDLNNIYYVGTKPVSLSYDCSPLKKRKISFVIYK